KRPSRGSTLNWLGTSLKPMVLTAGPVSTNQVNCAGDGSAMPAAFTAATWNVCSPFLVLHGRPSGSVVELGLKARAGVVAAECKRRRRRGHPRRNAIQYSTHRGLSDHNLFSNWCKSRNRLTSNGIKKNTRPSQAYEV